jgi:hypothetical protein
VSSPPRPPGGPHHRLGLYPQPLLDVINPAVETTLDEVGVTDPEPDVPVEAESTQEQETSQ